MNNSVWSAAAMVIITVAVAIFTGISVREHEHRRLEHEYLEQLIRTETAKCLR